MATTTDRYFCTEPSARVSHHPPLGSGSSRSTEARNLMNSRNPNSLAYASTYAAMSL
jgi:hypothetical protein